MNPNFSLGTLFELPPEITSTYPHQSRLEINPIDSYCFVKHTCDYMMLSRDANNASVVVCHKDPVILMVTSTATLNRNGLVKEFWLLKPTRRYNNNLSLSKPAMEAILHILVKEKEVSRKFQSAVLAFHRKKAKQDEELYRAEELVKSLRVMNLVPSAQQKKKLLNAGIHPNEIESLKSKPENENTVK